MDERILQRARTAARGAALRARPGARRGRAGGREPAAGAQPGARARRAGPRGFARRRRIDGLGGAARGRARLPPRARCARSASRRSSAWARIRRRGSSSARGPARTRTSRASRSWGRRASSSTACSRRSARARPRGLHRQRREVPPAGQPRAHAGGSGRVRALPRPADRPHRAADHRGAGQDRGRAAHRQRGEPREPARQRPRVPRHPARRHLPSRRTCCATSPTRRRPGRTSCSPGAPSAPRRRDRPARGP